ncbi:MAG: dephospho-CoA kinase [Planctomycetaceae bacterium TMED240]|nr:dephospho-CoA kinase [Rhodopirellula sp.]OUX09035.1 MAG: dephospho-CoA kinase [Planctomycetaceae bacterium TMED240]
MIVLGLVGTPAGGKSTVAERLVELGATWINADLLAKTVMDQPDVQADLIQHYGASIVNNDDEIDRAKLAALVFGDDDASRSRLDYLESRIHPETKQLIKNQLFRFEKRGDSVAILDVPLLFKSSWDRSCDEIWCVDSDKEIRIARVRSRGWTPEHLQSREKNQLEIAEKMRLSTRVILNNGTLAELNDTISTLWSSLVRQHSAASDPRHCFEGSGRKTLT